MSQNLYDRIGIGYSAHRRPDSRIAVRITAALGEAATVVNVGAGTGSYEPHDRNVVAVEPAAEMIRQRAASAAPAVRATAERLPFRDRTFQASMAVLTLHHWPDWRRGLAEMRRVASGPLVIFTWDPQHHPFWLIRDYLPEILDVDRPLFPRLSQIEEEIGPVEVRPVPIPADCADGFLGAYWRRPEAYLDSGLRRAISVFDKLTDAGPGLGRLRDDLADGSWARRNQEILGWPELDLGYRLIVA